MDQRYIRNFSVIAHIDHGKSTLADRFLELTGAVQPREMAAQVLDTMDLERERGITIKAHPVRLTYRAADGQVYILNLIDTPGHVDFSYEVTRSLAACEGALLLVDASQGVEAQTLANAYLAVDNDLEMLPVVNKIDLPGAQPEEVRGRDRGPHRPRRQSRPAHERQERHRRRGGAGGDRGACAPACGRPGRAAQGAHLRLVGTTYRGVVIVVRVIDGSLRRGMKVRLMAAGQDYELEEVGVFTPKPQPIDELASARSASSPPASSG